MMRLFTLFLAGLCGLILVACQAVSQFTPNQYVTKRRSLRAEFVLRQPIDSTATFQVVGSPNDKLVGQLQHELVTNGFSVIGDNRDIQPIQVGRTRIETVDTVYTQPYSEIIVRELFDSPQADYLIRFTGDRAGDDGLEQFNAQIIATATGQQVGAYAYARQAGYVFEDYRYVLGNFVYLLSQQMGR